MVASASQFSACTGAERAVAAMPCSAGSISRSGSASGLLDGPAGQKCSAAGTGSASTVTVTVVQCINSGIDSDASSTMAHEVMCMCGFCTRKRFKPIHTTPPSNRERSADSARIASIISSYPSPLF